MPTRSVSGRALGQRREIGLGGLQLRGQAHGVAEDALAGVSGNDGPPAAGALQQADAGRPLQRRHLHAHRGLRVPQLTGRAGERARHRDCLERREVADLDAEQSMRLFHHVGR